MELVELVDDVTLVLEVVEVPVVVVLVLVELLVDAVEMKQTFIFFFELFVDSDKNMFQY